MKKHVALLALILSTAATAGQPEWSAEQHDGFVIHYTPADKARIGEYRHFVEAGIAADRAFFGGDYKSAVDVYIHPDRASFDRALERQLKQPGFKSDCWLVAIGESKATNILSPARWDDQPCPGRYASFADKPKTQKLFTHELMHVFHGQHVADSGAADDGLDVLDRDTGDSWFQEGLAYYAAGQLDAAGERKVQAAVAAGRIPDTLDGISTLDDVNLRYDVWGSIVGFLDRSYGRGKLRELLAFSNRKAIFSSLGCSEEGLLRDWKKQASASHDGDMGKRKFSLR